MPTKPFSGNWMVAVAEAAEMAGASDLDTATADQMTKAWGLVRAAAGLSLEDLTKGIAEQAHLPIADLSDADPHAALLVPPEVARRRNVMALRCTDRTISIATANPLSQDAKREIANLSSRQVAFEVAPPSDVASQILTTYGAPTEAEESARGGTRPETAQPRGPHVLVVDDEAGQRALFRSVLEESGFRVSLAKDGSEAMERLAGQPPVDLVTLDYWMDKTNGLRVLQRIRAHGSLSTLPVIMVTGADDRRIEMSLFEAGADDFIVKPVDAPLFVLRIQAVLRRRRAS